MRVVQIHWFHALLTSLCNCAQCLSTPDLQSERCTAESALNYASLVAASLTRHACSAAADAARPRNTLTAAKPMADVATLIICVWQHLCGHVALLLQHTCAQLTCTELPPTAARSSSARSDSQKHGARKHAETMQLSSKCTACTSQCCTSERAVCLQPPCLRSAGAQKYCTPKRAESSV